MILIFSSENDLSTNDVSDWFKYFSTDFLRFNREKSVKIYPSFVEYDKTVKCSIKDIISIWFRRNGSFESQNIGINSHLNLFYSSEINKINEYLLFKLCEKKTLNNFYDDERINRLLVLYYAKKIGLKVPPNYLLESKEELLGLLSKGDLITKTILGSAMIIDKENNDIGMIYSNIISKEDDIPNFNHTSYFEKYIDKKYEIRTFYLDGNFFSMAIFSQKDNQTRVDFRHYNRDKPNRTIPFKLPVEIEKKISKLMRKLDLNSGSIDMIFSRESEFIFLEVNPVGQFGMVSFPCNYNIEKHIANYLSESN